MLIRFPAARSAALAVFACVGGLCLLAAPHPLGAAPAARPVTVPELCLLLHGGYTGDETLRETAGRPLLAPLDDDAEKTLRAAGADDHFIAALRASRPTLTDAEAEAARQQQATAAARDADGRAAYVSRVAAANKQALENRLAARQQEATGRLAERLRGQLVSLRSDQLQAYPEDLLAGKKLFAFYFAAGRSAPSRQFTPTLVKFYRDFAPRHPAFEVVFVSEDRNAAEMESTLRQESMPWPALAFDQRTRQAELVKLGQAGVPRLLVLDGTGRLVSDSVVEGKGNDPQHVLDDLTKLAAGGGG